MKVKNQENRSFFFLKFDDVKWKLAILSTQVVAQCVET